MERIEQFIRGDLSFDVLDEGPVDGEPVVLLHGFPQLNTSWAKVAPHLHEQGFRTIAPNQRGYSPGARPRGRRAYAAGELAADVDVLIDRIGAPAHLVGHDWGAMAAWATAILHGDRLRSLTTVSVPHPGAFVRTMPKGQALHSWYMAVFNIPALPELVLTNPGLARRFLRGSGMSEQMYQDYLRDFGDGGALRGGLGWYRALPFGDRALFGRHVTVPTTHVWSDRDGFLVRAGAELTGSYVDAPYQLEILPGVSHWVPEEEPERLAEIIVARARAAA